MSDVRPPTVSITMAVWNGMRWLPACLESIAAQTLDDYELLIIDDASTDDSLEWLRRQATNDDRVEIIETRENLGYARAHNRCLHRTRGEAVLLLNQDIVLDPGFLEAAVRALRAHPDAGSVQGRILRLGSGGDRSKTIDTTGLVMRRDRRVVSRDQLLTDGVSGRPGGLVWGADGPAPIYRRAALRSARLPRRGGGWEILDEDFFMHKEDVDLAWRVRRLGWTTWYEPAAIAWHARGGADSGTPGLWAGVRANMSNPQDTRIRSWRNQRLMQLKNDEPGRVLRDLPYIAGRELQQWLWMLVADRGRLRAVPELFRLAPMAMRKRRALNAAVRRRSRAT